MVLEISSTLVARLLSDAAASPDVEVCGLLFGSDARIEAAQACANVAEDPARAFEIDPAALFAAHRRARAGGPAVIGCYHSHPNGAAHPSWRDADSAAPDRSVWLIVGGAEFECFRAVVDGQIHQRFDRVAVVVAG